MLKEIKELANETSAEDIQLPQIEITNGAVELIPDYIKLEEYSNIVVVVDNNTKKVAGQQLVDRLLEKGIKLTVVELTANKHEQVIADEQTIVELMIATPPETDLFLAVGSGTIHDIVRFAGYKMNCPFISVPTAASVDGFTSKGAPLILRGVKQTIQTASPIAVFADINILKSAPKEMTAAGFGDILGKYTSLVDWRISHLIGGEPYNQLAANITKQSLDNVVGHVNQIAKADDQGIKILMESLIVSGLVMLILNHSRPASGAEHHLSHYWEMDLLTKDKRQLLHGAKVGVTTTIIASLYKQTIDQLKEYSTLESKEMKNNLTNHLEEIQHLIEELPNPNELKGYLKDIGGPSTPSELDISKQLVEQSLNEAYTLRNRCTGLFILNQLKNEKINIPQ